MDERARSGGFAQRAKQFWGRSKNAGASILIEKALRHRLAPFGDMLNFSVDSLQKKAHLEVLLKGEPEPLTIVVERYELVGGEKETAIILHEATASKEWMNAVLKEFVVGKQIAIPSKYASMARFVL